MSAGLTKLKHVRAGHQGYVTKFINSLSENAFDVDKTKRILTAKREALSTVTNQILELLNEKDDITPEIVSHNEFDEGIEAWLCKADKALAATISTTIKHSVKLPTLQMKKFSGVFSEWSCFWELFDATVNQSTQLSDIEKFNYLLFYLEGNALSAV